MDSNYKTINDHNDILFLCGFYYYLFQDRMDIPVILLFKVIFDYLIYFFNFNGDLKELIKNQANYNVIMGLLQNELGPAALSISAHNSCHYAMSVVLNGDLIVTSCFHSERMCQVIKKNCFSGSSPHLTCGRRCLTYNVAGSVMHMKKKDDRGVIDVHMVGNPFYEDTVTDPCGYGKTVSIHLDNQILECIVKVNAYDGAQFYKDSLWSYSFVCLF